jgi:hypothetical protein
VVHAIETAVPSSSAAVYRGVIDRTSGALAHRATLFRNLVAWVVVISISSVAAALIARSLAPLTGVLYAIPACGFFFLADARALDRWRSELLGCWTRGEIELTAFRLAIRANPGVPKHTTEAMLASLPAINSLVAEQLIAEATRRAAYADCELSHRLQRDTILLTTAASALVATVVSGSLWIHSPTPLACLTILGMYRVARSALHQHARRRHASRVEGYRRDPTFNESHYTSIVAGSP